MSHRKSNWRNIRCDITIPMQIYLSRFNKKRSSISIARSHAESQTAARPTSSQQSRKWIRMIETEWLISINALSVDPECDVSLRYNRAYREKPHGTGVHCVIPIEVWCGKKEREKRKLSFMQTRAKLCKERYTLVHKLMVFERDQDSITIALITLR